MNTYKQILNNNGQDKQVTIIVPVLNEQENVPILFQEIETAMQTQQRTWQVLYIDDGSTDNSLQVIKELAENNPLVRYISFAKNCGQSAAFAAGFKAANTELVITIDADLQNDPADIPTMLNLFDQGYDMVIGWRKNRQDTTAKRFASKIANAIRNAISHETVRDTGCSLKVLRTSMAEDIPMFTGMHRFLPTLMKMQGAKVAEVAVNHRARVHGTSKYSTFGRATKAFVDLLAVRWMQSRYFKYSVREHN